MGHLLRTAIFLIVLSGVSDAAIKLSPPPLFSFLASLEAGQSPVFTSEVQSVSDVLNTLAKDLKVLAHTALNQDQEVYAVSAQLSDQFHAHVCELAGAMLDAKDASRFPLLVRPRWILAHIYDTIPAVWRFVSRDLSPGEREQLRTVLTEVIGFLRHERELQPSMVMAFIQYLYAFQGPSASQTVRKLIPPDQLAAAQRSFGWSALKGVVLPRSTNENSKQLVTALILTSFQRELRSPTQRRCSDALFF